MYSYHTGIIFHIQHTIVADDSLSQYGNQKVIKEMEIQKGNGIF